MESEQKMNTEIRDLYKIRLTVLKTLRARKYHIPEGNEKLSYNDFMVLYSKNRHHLYFPDIEIPEDEKNASENPEREKGILVFFEPLDDFTKKILESRVSQLEKEYPNLARIFFVIKINKQKKKKINAFVIKALKNPEYSHVRILDNIYPFNFMDNIVLPKFTLLSKTEKEMFLKIHDVKPSEIPKIWDDDPVVKRFGSKLGDIFLISRDGNREISYRIVAKSGST
jgi:DNA-directed RNA polymerase subunit H (RpoH/RPB5)